MKKPLLIIFLYIIPLKLFCQDFNTSAQIFKIMEKSKVKYNLNVIQSNDENIDYSKKLNYNDVYRKYNDKGFSTKYYNVKDEVQSYLRTAEDFFNAGKYKEAREYYLKILELDSTYYTVMTYIGQTYGIEKNYLEAELWYKNTIKKNYIDYMAHWFLADIYLINKKHKDALEEISIALILNRNNPRIINKAIEIYKNNKLVFKNWYFNPIYKFESNDSLNVNIFIHEDWTGYALAKAVWKYEPGYKDSKLDNANNIMYQEKECIISQINIINKKNTKKYPEFNALLNAIENKQVDEYILFEILLPQNPSIAYQLNEDLIKDIKEYLVSSRNF